MSEATPVWAANRMGRTLRRVRSTVSAVVVLGCTAGVWAAATIDENSVIDPHNRANPASPSATGGGTLNALTLVVALAIAAVGAWLFWRNRNAPGVGREARLLNVEETRSLGNRQYLVVAAYKEKRFLLGVCPGRIDLLAPLHDEKKSEGRLP